MMAGVIWFVMLAYSWDVTFKALGTVRDDLTKKTAYFHIASWCLPLVLTIACLAISEVSWLKLDFLKVKRDTSQHATLPFSFSA